MQGPSGEKKGRGGEGLKKVTQTWALEENHEGNGEVQKGGALEGRQGASDSERRDLGEEGTEGAEAS